ncbi:MAG: hypothetical protein ACLGXA_00185 [Acidobacteriota bacterium]
MADSPISFVVIVKDRFATARGLGEKTFRVAPRVGDYITVNNPDGVGMAYRVKAIIHPLELAPTAGDLILESAGTEIDLMQSI